MLLAVASHPERIIHRDSRSYLRPAVNLLAGRRFSQEKQAPFTPDARRTPLYPLFIAAFYSLFGKHTLLIAGAQVVLSAITAGLTYLLGRRILPQRASYAGGWFLVFSLGTIAYAVYVMAETLFTILLLFAIYSVVAYHEKGHLAWAAAGGTFVGAATLCRPILLLYIPVLAIFVGWARGREHTGWQRKIIVSMIFLLIAALVIIPWVLRNNRVIGIPTLSTISDYNLLFYNAVSLEADLQGAGQAQIRAQLREQANEALIQMEDDTSEANCARLYRERGSRIIMAHPWRYMIVHLKNDINNLLPNVTELLELLGMTKGGKGTLSVLNRYGLWTAVHHYFGERFWLVAMVSPLIAMLGVTYLAALVGTVALVRQRKYFAVAILCLTIAYLLLTPGAASNPRFRVPTMPYLCLLAGVGWDTALRRVRHSSIEL